MGHQHHFMLKAFTFIRGSGPFFHIQQGRDGAAVFLFFDRAQADAKPHGDQLNAARAVPVQVIAQYGGVLFHQNRCPP